MRVPVPADGAQTAEDHHQRRHRRKGLSEGPFRPGPRVGADRIPARTVRRPVLSDRHQHRVLQDHQHLQGRVIGKDAQAAPLSALRAHSPLPQAAFPESLPVGAVGDDHGRGRALGFLHRRIVRRSRGPGRDHDHDPVLHDFRGPDPGFGRYFYGPYTGMADPENAAQDQCTGQGKGDQGATPRRTGRRIVPRRQRRPYQRHVGLHAGRIVAPAGRYLLYPGRTVRDSS